MNDKPSTSLNPSEETVAQTSSGYVMLAALVVALVFAILSLFAVTPGLLIISVFAFLVIAKGFYMLQPNQAAAILLFGNYIGTDRKTGLRWVWPWMSKDKLSTRANNIISETIKV